jgi:hypothetical protein
VPTSPEELLAEFTSLEFNTFTLDDMAGAMSNFDLAGSPTFYYILFLLLMHH